MNCSEVFTYRHYSDGILLRLHDDLQKIRHRDGFQTEQLARCREEMERRGMKLTNHEKQS